MGARAAKPGELRAPHVDRSSWRAYRRWMRSIQAFVLASLSSIAVLGCTIGAVAPTPRPNVLAKRHLSGTSTVDVSSVPDGPVCSKTAGLKDYCVERFRGSFDEGLKILLGEYVKPGGSEAYNATFKLVEFTHSPGSMGAPGMGTVEVSLRWQFTLLDASGREIVALAETTKGPKTLMHVGDGDAVVGALIDATLERIGAALNQADLAPPSAAAPTEPAQPASTQP